MNDPKKLIALRERIDTLTAEEIDQEYRECMKEWKPLNDQRIDIGLKVTLLQLAMFRLRLEKEWPDAPVMHVTALEIEPTDNPENIEKYILHIQENMKVEHLEVDQARGRLRVVGQPKEVSG